MNAEIDQNTLVDDIKILYEKICQAFAKPDLERVLSYFADHEEMVKISNGQVFRGKKPLSDYWRQHIGDNAGPQITVENIEVHKIDDTHAWAMADEYISLGGKAQKAVVSNLFVLTASGWKILLDHTTYVEAE